jgi:hypothetical protein
MRTMTPWSVVTCTEDTLAAANLRFNGPMKFFILTTPPRL